MSGGIAYVLDEDGTFETAATWSSSASTSSTRRDAIELHELIEEHHLRTLSPVAARILEDWEAWLPRFSKVMPHDYKRALAEMAEAERAMDAATRRRRGRPGRRAAHRDAAARSLRRVSFLVYLIVLGLWGLFVGAFARLALPGRDPMTLLQTMAVGLAGSFIAGLVFYVLTGGRAAPGFLGALVFSVLIVYVIRRRRGGGLVQPRGPRALTGARPAPTPEHGGFGGSRIRPAGPGARARRARRRGDLATAATSRSASSSSL